jgi:hypothetical protein
MRRTRWMILCWPGLAQVWTRGSWAGLGVAVSAAVLVNLAILGTMVWSELLPADLRSAVWIAVAVAWAGSAVYGAFEARRGKREGGSKRDGELFEQALSHYLKANWFETERALSRLLRDNSRDLEARLMLATLLRHTGRLDEAAAQLDVLARCDGSQRWAFEIGSERRLLAEARAGETDSRPEGMTEQEAAGARRAA